jgi:hypothetical protein
MSVLSSTCWSCQRVKGKRACPARGGELICSRCCGTKRGVEIHCPADCPYLHGAHDAKWESAAQQKEDARFFGPFVGLRDREAAFLFFVHHLILQASARFEALSDVGLLDVLEATVKTLETHSKGIVYQHACGSPEHQPLADWLVRVLTARGQLENVPEVSEGDVIRVLEKMRDAVAAHGQHTLAHRTYLETAARVMGPSLADAPVIELPEALASPRGDRIVSP